MAAVPSTGTVDRNYCTTADVEAALGFDGGDTNVSDADIALHILAASQEVDRLTFTTYHSVESSGTATSGASGAIYDTSQSWTDDEWTNYVCWVYEGTGNDQYARIASNLSGTLVFNTSDTFDTATSTDSNFRIIPDVIVSDDYDGNDRTSFFLDKYPVQKVVSMSIAGTTVSGARVYKYKNTGELRLHSQLSPQMSTFQDKYPQAVTIKHVYGVFPIPRDIIRLTACLAAIRALATQIGGTYETLSTFSLPHLAGTIGQGYINIRETLVHLKSEADMLSKRVISYPVVI